jgi:glutamine phosphoribosylpyrophosphate amidotransferase
MHKINEECGVFGVYAKEDQNLASMTYYGLYALQHRGQDSCGIVVNDGGVFSSHKALGLVGDVFNEDVLKSFGKGRIDDPNKGRNTIVRMINTNKIINREALVSLLITERRDVYD